MFSGQFYEKWMPVREQNIKLLLETVTYMDGYNENSHLHNYYRNGHAHHAL